MSEKLIKTHTFIFNPGENGGEQLRLVTKFYHNGETIKNGRPDPKGIFINQELILESYCNKASLSLFGSAISADRFEKLARALREAEHEAELEVASNEIRLPEASL